MATTTEPFSVSSMVVDVLQRHGTRSRDSNFASRRADEPSLRRYEAAVWLRKTVGVVGGKDFPAHPSEENFRLGLRSGIILCNALNKVQSGSVPKVVEGPGDSGDAPDGAAFCAYQYFENVRNFLVSIEEMGIPTFEASDLEQGGKSSRIVNCVLALKSYSEWKQGGGSGSWKFGGILKPSYSGKNFLRKNLEPVINFSRTVSMNDKVLDGLSSDHDLNESNTSSSLNTLVRAVLSDRRQEEIPIIMESMLSKVMEEFERRLASQNELMQTIQTNAPMPSYNYSRSRSTSGEIKTEENTVIQIENEESSNQNTDEASTNQLLKQQMLVEQQQRNIEELKTSLHTAKAGMQSLQIKCQEEFNSIGTHLFGLAHAATGYQRVLEENRKLYNQVQDLKGNIRVYCRVRPFLSGKSSRPSIVDRIEEGHMTINHPVKYGKEGRKSFSFNKVFGPSATQGEVFSDMQPLVRSVLDGFNVCIFAYGQTGSGKTHTMTGPLNLTEETLGVNYRALSDLFLLSDQRNEIFSYEISVQMIEIYNEQVRDLLVTDGLNKRLEIRNSSQNGINVPDARMVSVSSTSDVINAMNLGQSNRAVSATSLNDRSSRSHSCLTIHVQGKDLTSGNSLRGCMHLVDLAGSERVDKSEVTGDRLKEAQHINKSLSALGDVISSLSQKNSHVPYRNSKLTQLLQDSLGGQAKTLMFVHISPEPDAVGESISTLKFAERVSTVELGAARVNKDSADVKELKEQVASLKLALARREGEPDSPERFRMKSGASSPSHSDWQSMENVGKIEVMSNLSALKPDNQIFDIHELSTDSPPWPPVDSPGPDFPKDDESEAGTRDWVDKVMVNKQESLIRQLPQLFYQRSLPDSPYNKFSSNAKSRSETASIADSDDLETATTSDSSEPDLLWNFNIPRATSIPNGLGSMIKKPQVKPVKSAEMRSLIPSLIPSSIPSSSRKLQNAKRKNGSGK